VKCSCWRLLHAVTAPPMPCPSYLTSSPFSLIRSLSLRWFVVFFALCSPFSRVSLDSVRLIANVVPCLSLSSSCSRLPSSKPQETGAYVPVRMRTQLVSLFSRVFTNSNLAWPLPIALTRPFSYIGPQLGWVRLWKDGSRSTSL